MSSEQSDNLSGFQEPPGTLNCRCHHEELARRDPMVNERVIAIVRLLGLECLHMIPSIKLDHALIIAFVERWCPETHSFHLPHGEMIITLQDMEVKMGIPIKGEAMEPPGTLNCRCHHEELAPRDPMVNERVIAIVRLLGLECLHMIPSIKLDHALIIAFVERWCPETHSFHLPHGEMIITLQDMEVKMGIPIKGEAMIPTYVPTNGAPTRGCLWSTTTTNSSCHEESGQGLSVQRTLPRTCFPHITNNLPLHGPTRLKYKFIKKTRKDVDEVDRIDVLASDEAANHTETPDVGPSTSSGALVHTRCRHAPTPHLATETPNPPLSTPHDTTRPSMPPIPSIDTKSPLRFTHAGFESSLHTTTINHNLPMAPSYSSPRIVIPTLSLQTPQVGHTQLPPTSSSALIHVA
nr:serine/threonine-protein phosphatase 7 long form like [Quercus suber]